jgi:hypothetical protein
MDRLRIIPVAAAIIMLAGFIYGTIRLFELRFESGSIYPPYSTLRTDPLGTSAFYEGLGSTGTVKASRNIENISRISSPGGRTLFILGSSTYGFSSCGKNYNEALENFASSGGRLVISFAPQEFSDKESGKEGVDKTKKDSKEKSAGVCPAKDTPSFIDSLGVTMDTKKFSSKEPRALAAVNINGFPSTISWYSALCFTPDDPSWKTLYTRDGFPVIIERKYGKGSIVMCSDSYFISNEAMKKERHAGLLAWLAGNSNTAIFDETHLGISKKPGLATLIRKYGLMPFIASLAVLALLFIWRNVASLIPRDADTGTLDVDWGKNSASALVNLYKRNIKPSDLMSVCVDEHKRSFKYGRRLNQDLTSRIDDIINEAGKPGGKDSSVNMYRKISTAISKKGAAHARKSQKGGINVPES